MIEIHDKDTMNETLIIYWVLCLNILVNFVDRWLILWCLLLSYMSILRAETVANFRRSIC